MRLNKRSYKTKNTPQSLLKKTIRDAGILVIASLLLFACAATEANDHQTTPVHLTGTFEPLVAIATPDITSTHKLISTTALNIASTNASPPDDVLGFHPVGEMSFSDYQNTLDWSGAVNRGVGIGIMISNESWEAKQLVSLYIDGTIVTDETFVLSIAGSKHYYLSWAPKIQPGLHEAHLELITAEGDLLEYTWYFNLVEP